MDLFKEARDVDDEVGPRSTASRVSEQPVERYRLWTHSVERPVTSWKGSLRSRKPFTERSCKSEATSRLCVEM